MSIGAVIFDYGGVLTTPVRESIDAWIEADQIDPKSFSQTLKSWLGRDAPEGTPIHRLETGEVSVSEFNALIADELRTVSGEPVAAEGLLSRLFSSMRPEPAMYALAQDLKDRGIRVAILSNSWGNSYPRRAFAELFDPVVISAEVGLRKPHPGIYELALSRLGLPAAETAFVDDALPNVLGAQAVGINGVHHRGSAQTRAALGVWVPAL